MNFLVSVVLPVFNAELFVEKAIQSALQQPEVAEVVVVNDGSSDESLGIIKELQKTDNRIKILHHPDGINKGRSASRNLGIKQATSNYIAFLDADDFYLKDRFKNDGRLFSYNTYAEGVYNAIGVHFYRAFNLEEKEELQLFTLRKDVKPDMLFDVLMSGDYGYFSIDGLTIKASVLEKVGYFNEDLIVAEDTDLIFKMALKCKIYPGILNKALAMRGVHNKNIFNNDKLYNIYELKLYESLYYWSAQQPISIKTTERFLERIWILKYRETKNIFKHILYYCKLNLKMPKLVFTYLSIKFFPLVRFGKKYFSKKT